jgi:hypothetical protein
MKRATAGIFTLVSLVGTVFPALPVAADAPTLTLIPTLQTLDVGQSWYFSAMYDADGPAGPASQISVSTHAAWSSADPNIAVSYGFGKFQARAPGQTLITATYLGVTGQATMIVRNSNAIPPTVTTQPATFITSTSVRLNGNVNPQGSANAYFEYGTTPALGQTTPAQTLTGIANIPAFVSLTGLAPQTTYYYRVVAQNQFGSATGQIISFVTTPNGGGGGGGGAATLVIVPANQALEISQTWFFSALYDADGAGPQSQVSVSTLANWASQDPSVAASYGFGKFQARTPGTAVITATYQGVTAQATITVRSTGTAPFITTKPATNVNQTSATLNADVNPQGSATAYFEYGTTPSLGQTTGAQNLTGIANLLVSASLTGLVPQTTYYFRIVSQNQYGASLGQTLSFVTSQSGGGGGGGAATLVITPSSRLLDVGQTWFFSATYDPDGAGPMSQLSVSTQAQWTVQNPAVAMSHGFGKFQGVAPGQTLITATYQGVTAQAMLTVQGAGGGGGGGGDGTGNGTIVVMPSNVLLVPGQTYYLSVFYDSDGPGGPAGSISVSTGATLSSSNSAVVGAQGYGKIIGITPGTATVTATYQGASGTATVTVR